MHQSSSFTSWGLDRNWKTGMQLVKILCTAPNVTTKSNWLQSSGGGLAPHNAYTTMDASPCPPLQSVIIENVITFNNTYAHFNGVAFTTSYFKDKAHKVLHQIFAIVSFFSILFHFFPSFFFLFWKKGVIVMMMQQIGTCNWNATLKFRKPILLVTMEGRMKNLKCPDIRLYSKEADSDPNHREELFPLKNTDRLQEITAASLK